MTPQTHRKASLRSWALAVLASAPLVAGAATTNWIAYNDHNRGAGTAPQVSTYSPTGRETLGGPLTNFATGSTLPVGVSIAVVGDSFNGATGGSTGPNAGTPADLAFGGKVEWADSAFYFCATPWTASFTITFTNLNPEKKYVFQGVAQRGNNYATRWGSYMLVGAQSATPAHEQGPGSLGVITNGWSPYGDLLAPNTQVAINCGDNDHGDMIVWTEIVPDGTSFSVVSSNWLAATPGGAANSTYTYAINAFSLAEVDSVTLPVEIVTQPVGTNVVEYTPFSLSVQAAGSAVQYQWNKVGEGPIAGATSSTYSVAQAPMSATGDYYVVVYNSVNSVQSDTVHVEVLDDTVEPTIVGAVGSANNLEITVQFSEPMDTSALDAFSFDIQPALFVQNFRMTNSDKVMVLTLQDPALANTLCTVTFSDTLTDLAGNPLPGSRSVQFTSWVPSFFGGVVFQVYTNLSTTINDIAELTNDVNFPYNPAETYSMYGFNSRDAYPDDTHEGYGGRLRSLYIPQISGQYRLFLRSDDSSQLFFNPNGTDPAGKIMVAEVGATCCPAFQEPPSAQTTEVFDLVAGQGYYLEAIYKEGGGGDYCYVAARIEGDPVPAGSLTNLMNTDVGAMRVPPGIVGTMSIVQQPANATADAPNRATFSVTAATTLGSPFVYQWQKSDDFGGTFTDIPNATTAIYTTVPLVVADDDQDQYRVIVNSPAGQLTSEAAILTVGSDIIAPRLVSAVGGADLVTITLTYSEAVKDADDPFIYTLSGPEGDLTINDAVLLSGPPTAGVPTVIQLQTAPRVFGPNYTVTVESGRVTDISANANPVVPPDNTAIVSATGAILPFLSAWSYNTNGAPGQGTAWKEPGFDDTSWPVSNALFVAKNGTPGVPPANVPINTLMPMNGTNGAQTLTYYFRTHFDLPAYPSNVANLSLSIVVDDGAVVYLNGQELYSYGMPIPPPDITYTTLANVTGGTDYPILGPFVVPMTNLVIGDNVLAVELHQQSATSSDVAFALELLAQIDKVEPPRPPEITVQPVGGTVDEGQPFTFGVQAIGSQPLTYQWYWNNNPINGAISSSYTIASTTLADSGEYYVVVDNATATPVASTRVQLTVLSDSVAPTVVSAMGAGAAITTVVVTFSEAMAVGPAEMTSNYQLTGPGGITVVGALAAGDTVTLTLSAPLEFGSWYDLTVKDVVDTSSTPNAIAPNPTTLPVQTVLELVSINGQVWRYLHQTELGVPVCLDGTAWTESGFDASTWAVGNGVFFGNRSNSVNQPTPNPDALPLVLDGTSVLTILNVFTNDANNLQETNYYFRTTFNLPSATTEGVSLLLHSMVDDGAIFYLNGNRVGDVRYTADPATCTNFASAGGGQTWDPALASPGRALGSTGLVPGVNTLAVQVAQNNGTSSDITLGVLLTAELVALDVMLDSAYDATTQTLTLSWDAAGYVLEGADSVAGPWLPVAGASSPWTVSTATGNKFYRLVK